MPNLPFCKQILNIHNRAVKNVCYHNHMKREVIKSGIVGLTGAIGYLFCTLQWLWTIMLFLPAILGSNFVKQMHQEPVVPPTVQPAELSGFGIAFAIIVTLVVLIATIYILVKMPASIGKSGSKITHKAADTALPIITLHKKLPTKKRLQLTSRLLFVTKISLCTIPFVAMLFSNNTIVDMSQTVVVAIGATIALCSIIFFSAQAILAKLLHVDYKLTW